MKKMLLMVVVISFVISGCGSNNDSPSDAINSDSSSDVTNSRLSVVKQDDNADGSIDYIKRYYYNETGMLEREEIDQNADGDADEIITNQYENGNIVRQVMAYYDSQFGEINKVFDFVNDEKGLKIQGRLDNNGDGNVDFFYSYTYDDGHMTKKEYSTEEGGPIVYSSKYIYGQNTVTEQGGDGTDVYVIIKSTYDDNDNITHEEADYDADGIIDSSISWTYVYTYDDRGNITKTMRCNEDSFPNNSCDEIIYEWEEY